MLKGEKKPGQRSLKSAKSNPTANTYVDVKIEPFIVHVFFDGTGNNRFNTESYIKDESSAPKAEIFRVSYENYFSNIALLFLAMKEEDTVKNVYVEGSGTARGKGDHLIGMGLAQGATGRKKRIKDAFKQLNDVVGEVNRATVIINVYGFSRGAAWARHFCALLKDKNHSDWNMVKINFVGIYDTVSADGINKSNDMEDLGLDIGKPQEINFVAHITAKNDYRKNFPLTRIDGAIKDGIGFECSFPGAHSNIGGGYSRSDEEKEYDLGLHGIADDKQDEEYVSYQWFLDTGYYTEGQIKIESQGMLRRKHRLATRSITNHYQFVTAYIMREITAKKSNYKTVENSIMERGIGSMQSIDVLKRFHAQAYTYVMEKLALKGNGYTSPLLTHEDMQALYNGYIHNSLHYGTIANKGTILNKNKRADGRIDWASPIRPEVNEGYRT